MPQGKMKTKVKLPDSVAKKKKTKKNDNPKGVAKPKRMSGPAAVKQEEAKKLKKNIKKAINEAAESELREIAFIGKKTVTAKPSKKGKKK